MRNHRSIGKTLSNPVNAVAGEFDVHIAGALPQIHFAPGLLHDPRTKILIRNEQNISVGRRIFDHFNGVSARADNIGKRLNASAAIDVRYDVIILVRMIAEKCFQLFGWTRFR